MSYLGAEKGASCNDDLFNVITVEFILRVLCYDIRRTRVEGRQWSPAKPHVRPHFRPQHPPFAIDSPQTRQHPLPHPANAAQTAQRAPEEPVAPFGQHWGLLLSILRDMETDTLNACRCQQRGH